MTDNTAPDALLPCPFCGSSNILEFSAQDNDGATVECRNCRGATRECSNLQTAIKSWNTRATPSKPTDINATDNQPSIGCGDKDSAGVTDETSMGSPVKYTDGNYSREYDEQVTIPQQDDEIVREIAEALLRCPTPEDKTILPTLYAKAALAIAKKRGL